MVAPGSKDSLVKVLLEQHQGFPQTDGEEEDDDEE